jgi:hypothetical protein
MNPVLRQVVGKIQEHEAPDGKMPQSKVVYVTPDIVNRGGQSDEPGCKCGKCAFFNSDKSECFLTDPAHCNADHGVCALFLGGRPFMTRDATPQRLISKEAAGYIEDETNVPTRCANCEYFEGSEDKEMGSCKKVTDPIYRDGCCNGWEPKEGGDEED